MHSYHIFYFPFKWEIKDQSFIDFSQSTDLKNIQPNTSALWDTNHSPQGKEAELLYDEKNYYYEFVHPILYDTNQANTLLKHFERKEPQSVSNLCAYVIKIKKGEQILEYRMKLDALNLNFYSTGVGMLSFYLANENYDKFEDILNINQYGRRIFPPFFDDIKNREQIALNIQIEGLFGNWERYVEDFSRFTSQMDWHPAKFIAHLIEDLQSNLAITPVIDDRMFVNCWYQSKDMASQFYMNEDETKNLSFEDTGKIQFKKGVKFINNSDWYRYLFIDASEAPTCRNYKMRNKSIESSTYMRWQESGSLYGVTRYSFMLLTDTSWYADNVLSIHMRTIYSRMIELILMQRASMLKFSEEVTKVSHLKGENDILVGRRIGALYQEYIRFINQIYFHEVTAQDQGSELYNLLFQQFNSEKRVKDLDDEIGELHGYVSLLIDNSRNVKASWLNIIAAIFLPPTLLSGLFGMNPFSESFILPHFIYQLIIILVSTILTVLILKRKLWIH